MFICLLQVLLEEIAGIHPNPETEDGFEVWLNIPENFKVKLKLPQELCNILQENSLYKLVKVL